MQPIVTDRVAWSVGRSLGLSVGLSALEPEHVRQTRPKPGPLEKVVRLSKFRTLFRREHKSNFSPYQRSVAIKYAKCVVGRDSVPGPVGGAHDDPPYLLVASILAPSALAIRRLRRDLDAFGVLTSSVPLFETFRRRCLSVCHTSEPCKNVCTDRDAVWVEDSGGPREDTAQMHCVCNTIQLSKICDFRVSAFCQVVQKHKLFEVAQ